MMEKASSTPNRLTRSSTRNTPSKKSEDSSEIHPADEIKHNLRKSRRKTETKLTTNGDSLNDVDTNKLRNCDEMSEGNSLDGCDSEDSNISSVHKNTSQSNKVSSPTISRRSLRPRSITPGPEVEPSVTRKMRRSTSESKIDSVLTPTKRRRTRAKSESKDFVFSPSKNDKDYENSTTDSNSKCIPINCALRVIDETIEEDNEIESHHESKKSTTNTVKVETNESVTLKMDIKEDTCKNENLKPDSKQCSNALPVTKVNDNSVTSEADGDIKAVGTLNKTTEQLEMSAGAMIAQKSGNQLSPVREVDATQEATSLESNALIDSSDQCQKPQMDSNEITFDVAELNHNLPIKEIDAVNKSKVGSPSKVMSSNSDSVKKSNNQLSALEEANDAQETSNQEVDIIIETADNCSTPQSVSNECIPALIVAEVGVHSPLHEISEGDNKAVDTFIERQDHLEVSVDPDTVTTKENCQLLTLGEVAATQEIVNKEVDTFKETGDQLSTAVCTESSNKSSDQLQTSERESIKEKSVQLPISEEITSGELSEEAKADLQSDDNIINNVEESSSYHGAHIGAVNSLNNDVLSKNSENDELDNKTDEPLTKCIEIDDLDSEKELHNLSNTQSIESLKTNNDNGPLETTVLEMSTTDSEIECLKANNDNGPLETTVLEMSTTDSEIECLKANNDNGPLKTTQIEISTADSENVPIVGNNNISLMLEVESENEDLVTPNQNLALTKLAISESVSLSPPKSLIISDTGTKSSQNEKLETDEDSRESKNDMQGSFIEKDSASESELYKNMSDFGSDMDEKQDGSHYGDSASSSELRSGDSDEYVSSFDGEEDEEETNNVENEPSNEKRNLENIHKSINNTKMAGNDFDNKSPMTYDKALAIINKNRVKKIDDEEFFDMFTQELNKVSEESGSDSDIAIVDEYIAEPDEKQQKKPNQKPGNPQANVKNTQKPAHPNSVSQRPMPPPGADNQQISMQQRINLKSSQKSGGPPNSVSNNFSGTYNQQAQTDHSHPNMARMNFSQGGLYHQYNQTMPPMDSNRAPYDQFASSNHMDDPRMFQPHHMVPDNFSRGGMYGHPLGPISDAQLHYSGGSTFKVRNIDTMCGSHPPNLMNMNLINTEPAVNPLRNENDCNQIMGVSASTMTESGEKQERRVSNISDEIANPILDILGMDKKKLKMLKNILGLTESREKQRAKIKQMLIEEAHKMGLSLKSPAKIKNQWREQKRSSESSTQSKVKNIQQVVESGSDSSSLSLQSHSVHSGEESNAGSELASSVSKDSQSSSESSNENEAGMREVNIEDGDVYVRIDTRHKRKPRHRSLKVKHIPVVSIITDERKRRYQHSESSDEGNLREIKKRKPKQRSKMVQEKKQNKKQPTVLQLKWGTFNVDTITSASQSESETMPEDSTKSRAEQIRTMKEELATGKNKLSNMFRQHSLREGKKGLKRKMDTAFSENEDMEPKVTKSKRLPADIVAQLGGEEKKTKRQKKNQTSDSESEKPQRPERKQSKRAVSKKLKISSTAAQKQYIPLVVAGPTQFGLQRLDKDGTLSCVEKAAKFRSDQLYGSSVKRITSQELLNVKKKQQRNKLVEVKAEKKKSGRK